MHRWGFLQKQHNMLSMKKTLSLFAIALFLFACNTQESKTHTRDQEKSKTEENTQDKITFKHTPKEAYEGIIYRDFTELEYFKDFEDYGGGMIGGTEDKGFALERAHKDGVEVLIMVEIISTNTNKVNYKAYDAIEISGLADNEAISYCFCRLNEEADGQIIAVYKVEDKEYFTQIVKAWRADYEKGEIYEIDTDGIDCVSEGWGA